ncbi:MAG: hypothetical protein SFY67_00220 [Candidatus Melainabacteria bacterium]|nr:hypothetical protein [Candidatus Melainabacteria bacterium]
MSKFLTKTIALIFLLVLHTGKAFAYTDTPSEAINLNNIGVNKLNKGDYEGAISKLEASMKIAPNYEMARSNYSIALNNYGLASQLEPLKALHLFERALYFDFDNITTQHNCNGIIRMLSLDPKDPFVRIDLGSKAIARGDLIGAVTEFKMASNLIVIQQEESDEEKKDDKNN